MRENFSQYETDVLIIGSGLAGLSLALRLAQQQHKVIIICKQPPALSSSAWAQGGIAAALDHMHDSPQQHYEDTLYTGAGLCDRFMVKQVTQQAGAMIAWLSSLGVPFTQRQPSAPGVRQPYYHLLQEGGHAQRRVAHVADHTGRSVIEVILNQLQKYSCVRWFVDYTAIDLIVDHSNKVCQGAYVLTPQRMIMAVTAHQTVLATGGASKVYFYTSNPDTSTGDGIAMAWRAGCRIANLEFNQFHPTCLYHPKAKSFLISESLRGEGGRLTLPHGRSFLEKFDPRAELAPRDIVARAIDYEMKRLGLQHVCLDITHRSPSFIRQHFPHIFKRCYEFGLDITRQPIPVVPAAHYTCGGIVVDQDGCTDLRCLYAIGEVACSGLHGANRLASNSLLECLVMACSASTHIEKHAVHAWAKPCLDLQPFKRASFHEEGVVVTHSWHELRHLMWNYAGIVRSSERLQRAKQHIHLLKQEIEKHFKQAQLDPHVLELRNLIVVAELIVLCALSRQESRGLHYHSDYPKTNARYQLDTVLSMKHGSTRLDPIF